MIKSFNKFLNEGKSDIDNIFSDINKHINKHSVNNIKKMLTSDGVKKIPNTDLRKSIYYLYDNGVVKKISISKIVDNNMEYFILSDSERGLYENPEKITTELKYDEFIFKNLKKLVSKHKLNLKEIEYKLSKKMDIKSEKEDSDKKDVTKEKTDNSSDNVKLTPSNNKKLIILNDADVDNRLNILYDGKKAQVIGVSDNINIIFQNSNSSLPIAIDDEHLNKIKIL